MRGTGRVVRKGVLALPQSAYNREARGRVGLDRGTQKRGPPDDRFLGWEELQAELARDSIGVGSGKDRSQPPEGGVPPASGGHGMLVL